MWKSVVLLLLLGGGASAAQEPSGQGRSVALGTGDVGQLGEARLEGATPVWDPLSQGPNEHGGRFSLDQQSHMGLQVTFSGEIEPDLIERKPG